MPFTTISLGLTLTVPTNGTTNWGTQLQSLTWEKISSHDHTGSGNGSQLPPTALTDNTIGPTQLEKNLALTQQATKTPAGTTETIDWDDGNKAAIDLSSATGDVSLTLSNPIAGAQYRLLVAQGGTKRNIVWAGNVLFPADEEPTQYQEINSNNMILMEYDGANYYCMWENSFA